MKQTAVEYLLEFCEMANCRIPNDIIEQAKAMEKEQIIDVWIDAYTTNMKNATRSNFLLWANNYYNETFNTNEK